MFESLKARLDRMMAEAGPRDRQGLLAGALVEAKAAVLAMRDALAATDAQLSAERQALADAARRRELAAGIDDAETVAIADRFAAKHRERAELLARKREVQLGELALAEREVAEMTAQLRGAPGERASASAEAAWQEVEAAGGVRPETDLEDRLAEARLDQARREQAVAEQLAFLKKKLGKD